MKKILSVIFIMALIIATLTPVAVVSATSVASISAVADEEEIKVGDVVTITFSLGAKLEAVKTGNIALSYDRDVFSVVADETFWTLYQTTMATFDVANNKGAFAYNANKKINASSNLFVLTLEAKKTATQSDIKADFVFKTVDSSKKEVPLATGTATTSVTVKSAMSPGHIWVEDATVIAGKTFTVALKIEDNPGFSYLELTPNFSDKLKLESVENGTLVSNFSKTKNYVWTADEDVKTDGTLIKLTFSTASDLVGGVYNIGFTLNECVNCDKENVGMNIDAGTITVLEFLYGDANGDGEINDQDVTWLKAYLANYDYDTKTSTIEIGRGADVNGDGEINGKDVIRLMKYLTQ